MNKVFFCDLDGTLIKIENGKQKVSEENVKFINEYQSNGNEFIIASGRNATSIEQIKHDYKIHTNYLIADNGAIVLKRNEVIFTKKIKKEIAKSIIDLVQGQELQLFFSNGNKTFAEKCKEDLWAADKSRNIVDDIYEEFEKNETITKLSFYAKKSEPELYKLAQKYAKEIKDKYGEYLEVCDASTDFFIIDIQAKNVSKGTAIK